MSRAAELVALLSQRAETVATAESCTGGMIGAAITAVPGSSHVFAGGIISYADSVKRDVLGVPAGILDSCGAVSEPVVRAMAEGARRLLGTTWAIAVSGVAGPDGGTAEKPVGLVWIALDGPGGAAAKRYRFAGGRGDVRRETVETALTDLLAAINRME